MAKIKVAVVTGANRGIGYAISDAILQQHGPVKLYACSRAGKDLGLKPADSKSQVLYPKLDITQRDQIQDLVSRIKSDGEGVDVLVNNAGVNKYSDKPDDAIETFDTNYYGTLSMCQSFVPLMNKGGRVVNVSSTASLLHMYDQKIQNRFRDPNLGLEGIESLAKSYIEAVKSGNLEGWGDGKGYCFSKACMNAMTAFYARERSDLLINCCCPGWVDTDTGNIVGKPPKSIEDGAKIPLRLAFGDIGGVTGRYWANKSVTDCGDGDVVNW